jgi:uncharacterized lipoprotein YddW (UPF0748 family)
MSRIASLLLVVFAVFTFRAAAQEAPPEPRREFRGAWVATVYNLDWPSKPGLSAKVQKEELLKIFDRLVGLKLNAVVLQVRPQCDAFYASQREPWSPFLSGTMGEDPGYDPLAFAVEEAHARGLELHAWFNPFRALASAGKEVSSGHVSKQHPEWIVRFNKQLWLDPGEPAARDYSLDVILDVVRRYDIDAVHMDDYFYPYPSPQGDEFADDASFLRFREKGGKLDRDNWRRDNINRFVEQLYSRVKEAKNSVKVGISPFGIWRPGVPSTIQADLDSYAHIYADSRLWLREGWCDYFSPQLYWSIQPAKQSFQTLLDWWAEQNSRGRHLWPGLATERIGTGRPAIEILNQIALTRRMDGSKGHIHWNTKALMNDLGGITNLLRAGPYSELALVPSSPWLAGRVPQAPTIDRNAGTVGWRQPDGAVPRWWLVQTLMRGKWTTKLLPGATMSIDTPNADAITVRAIDRAGLSSDPTVSKLR